MKKIRYVIVGSGWRSLYYVRVAKALPERFELCAMLCRTQEKARRIAEEHKIYTTVSREECRALRPDFVVVAVNKENIAKVSMEWMEDGFTVLCETPAASETDMLRRLWDMHRMGGRLVVAEQYTRYPLYEAMLRALGTGIIGEPDCLNISLAHEYHGASLIRAFLRQSVDVQFRVRAKEYQFPTAETLSRYERFTDGRIADKKRTVAAFEFPEGKAAFYDFDSERYRSPIRRQYVRLQGRRGEMNDDTFYYLDRNNCPGQARLVTADRILYTGDPNPNLNTVREIVRIELQSEDAEESGKSSVLYEPVFGCCGLAQDETAVARLMADTADYAEGKNSLRMETELRNALQDAYTAILLTRAIGTGETLASERQPWQ